MTIKDPLDPNTNALLEMTLPTAQELLRLGLATLIDIRQSFEIEVKGAIPESVHIPLFEVKMLLGHALSENEQEILDTGKPKDMDVKAFLDRIDQLQDARDKLLLCICNSGRRSLTAAALLRSRGYPKALSVAGGFQAWKKMQADQAAPTTPAPQWRTSAF